MVEIMNKIKKLYKKTNQYYSENNTMMKFLISFLSIFIIRLFKEIMINMFGFCLSLVVEIVMLFLLFGAFSYGTHFWKYRRL